MSLVITRENIVPPGGNYIAKCDHCGARFKKHYPDGVVTQYNEHLRANGLPEKSREEIVQLICRDTPANICQGAGYQFKDRSLTWKDVLRGTRVLVSFLAAGRPLVTMEEAQRRANICQDCPENVPFSTPCSGMCPELEAVVNTVVGGKRTANDGRLLACHVCGCSNKAHVHVPLDILAKGVTKEMEFPSHCWKKEAQSLL